LESVSAQRFFRTFIDRTEQVAPVREYVRTAPNISWRMNMQNLPATLMTALLTIAVHGASYAADSEDSPYVMQQDHAAPVTITELPWSEPPARVVGNSPQVKGAELRSSNTAAETTSIEDQQRASEAYADCRQWMIERCEQNNGIDCARGADVELGAEALQQDHVIHVMRRPDGMR
jgi:hypothetical protein